MPPPGRRVHAPASLALTILVLALGGLTATGGPEPASAPEATLEWEPGRVGGYRAMFVPFKSEPPKDLAPLPDLVDARYARIRWGAGRGLSLALDVAPGHERLFVDLDLDGDLRDEAGTSWSSAGPSGSLTRTVLVLYEDESEPVPVAVRFYRASTWDADRVRITPWVHRRGHVVLGGRLRAIALLDDNADLRFDDPDRDRLYVDVDGNGSFTTGAGSHEDVGIGKPFRLGDEGWQAEVPSPSGRTVRFVRLAEAPPRVPRRWPRVAAPGAGLPQTPPSESFEDLARLLQEERDGTYAERVGTISKLGRLGTPDAMDLLLCLVKTEMDANVRAAATRALGNPAFLTEGAKEVIEIATSAWSPASVASAAIQALHGMDYPDRGHVYRLLLGSSEATVVGAAARHLVYLGDDDAVRAVLAEWNRGPADAIRYQIYTGLRSLPEGPPEKVMLEAAASDHTSMAAMALRDLLAVDHPETKARALTAAARRPIQEYLGKAVTDVLGAIGDEESVKALLAMAQEGTPTLERYVASHLASVRETGAVNALMRGLRSRSPKVRDLAAQILAGITEARVTETLMARVRRERDPIALASLLDALGDHGDERSIDLLLGHAKRRRSAVRQAAIRALARVGLRQAKVRAFFLTLLGVRSWEDRVLAIDAAAASGDPKLCPRILPNLEHARRQVRLATAQALATLRCPEAIEPLIKRLETEEEVRIVDAVAAALYRITGMNLYDDAATWRRWWRKEGARFRPPETVKDLPPHDTGDTRAGFYGIPVRSGRVIFVIDQSGSMNAEDARPTVSDAPSGNRLDVAVREVLRAVKEMEDRDFVNVILFHTTIHPWQDALTRLTSKNRHTLQQHLLGKKPTGGTNLYDALEIALLDPEVDTIFLLSDGVPGSGKYVAKDDILRAVRRLNQMRRVAIHGISIGRDSDLLRELADENQGQYVHR